MRRLEASGRLNRELEVLPDEETLSQRRQLGQGLFRPEVAVLLAYAKMALYDELLASDLPDDPYLLRRPDQVFPAAAAQALPPARSPQHRLRREIIATLVANSLVNRGLGEFVGELERADRALRRPRSRAPTSSPATPSRLVPLFGQIELLAGTVGADYQIGLLGEARLAIARGTEWFLRNSPSPLDMRAAVERFAPGIASLLDQLDLVLPEVERRRFAQAVESHRGRGIEAGLARRLAGLPYLFPACEVIAVADQVGTEAADRGPHLLRPRRPAPSRPAAAPVGARQPAQSLGAHRACRALRGSGRGASPADHPGLRQQPRPARTSTPDRRVQEAVGAWLPARSPVSAAGSACWPSSTVRPAPISRCSRSRSARSPLLDASQAAAA